MISETGEVIPPVFADPRGLHQEWVPCCLWSAGQERAVGGPDEDGGRQKRWEGEKLGALHNRVVQRVKILVWTFESNVGIVVLLNPCPLDLSCHYLD